MTCETCFQVFSCCFQLLRYPSPHYFLSHSIYASMGLGDRFSNADCDEGAGNHPKSTGVLENQARKGFVQS